MPARPYRLLTRSDFDGLVCAVLLKELELVEDISFAHPKDVQDGKVEVTDRDILTNLPYVEGCHLCFDHHASEEIRAGDSKPDNQILSASADSASRVLYDHFGGAERFPNVSAEMMDAVDRADSARFTIEEVLEPSGWALLSTAVESTRGSTNIWAPSRSALPAMPA